MDKLKSIYSKLGLKKKKVLTVVFAEGAFLADFWIRDFGRTSMYTSSAIMLLVGMCIFMCIGNNDGTTEGMGLVGMLEFYPVDLRKLYIFLMKEAVKFSMVHLSVSMLIASEMDAGYKAYIVMALVNIAVTLYAMLCYHIGLGTGGDGAVSEDYSIGTANAVCFILSPILAAAVWLIYYIIL